MLVDLARNDVNRVCDPLTCRVDQLMVVQKVYTIVHYSQVGDANQCSSRTCNISSRRSLACSDQARHDSMLSAPSFLQAL
jgi:hypothetical protein